MSRTEHFDAGAGGSYRGRHTAPGPGELGEEASRTFFHDPQDAMPDVHEHPEYYEHLRPASLGLESVRQLRAARDKPDADVHIYRAVPKGVRHIHPGDWVSTSRKYAEGHARSEFEENDSDVIHATAKAKDLHTEGYLHEWGYQGAKSLKHTP